MKDIFLRPKFITLLLATRPAFLTASAAPVLVGSAAGFAYSGNFNTPLFVLALFAIMLLHSGSNVANDYFDHISRNDWLNKNPTPFSGGRQFIQKGILSPKATLILSLVCLATGAAIGTIIFILTKSAFIFFLGVIGILGGFFYTAPPAKLGYRCFGETAIAFLFGILPVTGSFYLQTGRLDLTPLLPGLIVGILIFLVILINEFPDSVADAKARKKTIVVALGPQTAIWIYRTVLITSYAIAIASILISRIFFFAGLFFLLTLPLGFITFKLTNPKNMVSPAITMAGSANLLSESIAKADTKPNQLTILLHLAGCLALTIGFLITAFCKK